MDVALWAFVVLWVAVILGGLIVSLGGFRKPQPPEPAAAAVIVPPDTATLRRIRMAARAMGCNSAQRQMTEAYAAGLMARGESCEESEEMARVFAGDLLHIDAERRSILR